MVDYREHEVVGGHEISERPGEPDFENLPIVITFTPEQHAELKGTALEGARGIRLLEERGRLIAEELA